MNASRRESVRKAARDLHDLRELNARVLLERAAREADKELLNDKIILDCLKLYRLYC